MDVSEKLVEILQDENNPVWRWFPNNMAMMQLVDYLISSGVTVQEDCKDCAKATQNCIVKLQEQIAELRSAQEWISVDDRLPEPFVSVLVQMPGEKPFPTVREGFISNDGIWQSAMFRREPGEVTHWQPMPQPPKGE